MAETTIGAMKELVCCIRNDGTTPDQITDTNATMLWNRICEAFDYRFNGGASADISSLRVICREGVDSGTTLPVVSGATGENFRYMVGANLSLPSAGDDLSTWAVWSGGSVAAEDGQKICIAQVDENNLAVKAGIATVIIGI